MIRILFVEDDPIVMSTLRHTLSDMHHEWEMRFAMSAEEALTMLDELPYDVVVSDYHMPGLKGDELLALVRYQHQRVIRVLLLEEHEGEGAARGAGAAHCILRKPCDPRQLAVVVERACELEQRLADPDLQAIVAGIGTLPSPTGMVLELNDLLNRDDTTAGEVAQLIENDAAMTAKLLQRR